MENTKEQVKTGDEAGANGSDVATSGRSKKHSKLVRRRPYMVAIIVLAVLVLVGVGFGVYEAIMGAKVREELAQRADSAETEEKAEIVDETGETITITTESDGEKEAQVKALLADLAEEMPGWFNIKNSYGTELPPSVTKVYDTVNGYPLTYRPEGMKISVPLERYYGLSVGPNSWDYSDREQANEFVRVIVSELPDKMRNWLKARGFRQYDEYGYALMNDEGMICGVAASYPGPAISCSWTTWFDAKKAEFSNRVALESGFPEGQTLSLDSDNLSIKNSKNAPYQTMTGGILGAVGLWYRVSPEAAWQWFRGTQMVLGCEEYDTDDLKKAYEGEKCMEGGEMSEVRL